jgi:hypothetical protein
VQLSSPEQSHLYLHTNRLWLPSTAERVPPIGSSGVDQIHYHVLGTGMHSLDLSILWVLCAATTVLS